MLQVKRFHRGKVVEYHLEIEVGTKTWILKKITVSEAKALRDVLNSLLKNDEN